MKRRAFLQTASATGLALTGGLALPHIARAQGSKVLRFVPQANLSSLDAVAGTQYVVRNAAVMIWETLYGVNARFEPKPQMCEGHEVDAAFKTWTFKLRPGLKFHDGEPVLAKDCIASIKRWAVRDTMGQMIAARLDAAEVIDDRTFRLKLKSPFPKMLFALGKSASPTCLIMPERIARTDPFKLVSEYVGSGPFKFNKAEWVPGAKAVFEKNPDYQPRSEPGEWLSGGKKVMLDRVEWVVMDPATAGAALQNGEVDWVETPLTDLVPLLKQNAKIKVDIGDSYGNIGTFRMNHLQPPFNDVRVRRAIMMTLDQAEYMQAAMGDDTNIWKHQGGFFTYGAPFYTEAGAELLNGKRDFEGARKLIAEAGATGAKVTLLVTSDVPLTKAMGDVSQALLTKLGFNVDYVAADWGTVGARRAKKDPPSQGGWNVFHTWHAGADCVNPASYTALDAGGDKAWFGWPSSQKVQDGIASWYAAPDAAAEKKAIDNINIASCENVTYVPTGFFQIYQAWRNNVSGVVKAPFPVFWGVQKA